MAVTINYHSFQNYTKIWDKLETREREIAKIVEKKAEGGRGGRIEQT